MMNKYQEALDIIVEKTDMLNNTCLHLPKCMKNGICHYVGEGLCEDYKRVKLLQELVDKETPVKPKIIKEEKYEWYDIFDGMRFYCPKCENELCCPLQGTKITRCDECGQRLDWSDE